MTEKVGEGRELRELCAKWREEAAKCANEYPHAANERLDCATELEAALAKQTPAGREQDPFVIAEREAEGCIPCPTCQTLIHSDKLTAQQTPHAAGQDALREARWWMEKMTGVTLPLDKAKEFTEHVATLESAEHQCNYYFGGFDGGHRCQKPKGHDSAHEWRASQTSTAPGAAREGASE